MSRGGTRPGAGRKPDAELDLVRSYIDAALKPKDWATIIKGLAASDNPRSVELLLKYRFGLPVAQVDLTSNADSLFHIFAPAIEGDHEVGAAQGAAMDVSPKHGGRAAVRRGGGRGKK